MSHSHIAGAPDYSVYTLQELDRVLATVDREEFPDRYHAALEEFRRKAELKEMQTGLKWYEPIPTERRVTFPARWAGALTAIGGLPMTAIGLAVWKTTHQAAPLTFVVLGFIFVVLGILVIARPFTYLVAGLVVNAFGFLNGFSFSKGLGGLLAIDHSQTPLAVTGGVVSMLALILMALAYRRRRELAAFSAEHGGMMLNGIPASLN